MTRTRLKIYFALVGAALGLLTTSPSFATNIKITLGNVAWLESSYMPSYIPFKAKFGDANCPAGTFLTWSNSDRVNVRAVYDILATSKTYALPVYAYYDSATLHNGPFGNGACAIAFIGLE